MVICQPAKAMFFLKRSVGTKTGKQNVHPGKLTWKKSICTENNVFWLLPKKFHLSIFYHALETTSQIILGGIDPCDFGPQKSSRFSMKQIFLEDKGNWMLSQLIPETYYFLHKDCSTTTWHFFRLKMWFSNSGLQQKSQDTNQYIQPWNNVSKRMIRVHPWVWLPDIHVCTWDERTIHFHPRWQNIIWTKCGQVECGQQTHFCHLVSHQGPPQNCELWILTMKLRSDGLFIYCSGVIISWPNEIIFHQPGIRGFPFQTATFCEMHGPRCFSKTRRLLA